MPSLVVGHAVSEASTLVAYEGFTPTVRHETNAKHFLRGVACREDPSSEFPGAGFRVYTSEGDLTIPIARIAIWDGASTVLISSFTPASFEGSLGGNNNGIGWDGTNVLLGQNGFTANAINQYVRYVGDTSTVGASFTVDDSGTGSEVRGSSCGWHTPDADLLTSQWYAGTQVGVHRKHDGFSPSVVGSYAPTTSGIVGASRYVQGIDWADNLGTGSVVYNRQVGASQYNARRNDGFSPTQLDEFVHGSPPNPEWLGAFWLNEGMIAQKYVEFDAVIPFLHLAMLSLLATIFGMVEAAATLQARVAAATAAGARVEGAALAFQKVVAEAAAKARVEGEAAAFPKVDAAAKAG